MPKELVNGAEYFDGDKVEVYELRFLGSAYMSEADAAGLCNGDLVTLMVTVRLGDPKFSYIKKTGDLKRSNGAKVMKLVAFDPEQAAFIYDNLGIKVEGVNDGFIESSSTLDKIPAATKSEEMFDL
jgi:hypothetical protein